MFDNVGIYYRCGETSMISNVQQKVSDAYRKNPFWGNKTEVLDFEEQLIEELRKIGWADETILLDALEYLGWKKLVHAYEEISPNYG
jgi:nuclear transport factor 2 (NTF2) superfamily protein